MHSEKTVTRRQLMKVSVASASSMAAAMVLPGFGPGRSLPADGGDTATQAVTKQRSPAAPRVRGPFPILSTPYTDSGEVDFEVLARSARYADWCESPGIIWPQSNDSIDLLTTEEKLKGMEVLAKTARDFRTTALCLGVQGKDTDDMLVYAKHAEKLSPEAIISRPPDSGRTQDDLRQYWRALASVTKRPVILQTTGSGGRYQGPAPSIELMTELADEFPNFGYVKEEAGNVIARTRKLLATPSIRRVFSARGGNGWLYEARLGTEGLITERMAYADLLANMWKLMQSGNDPAALKDAYSKFTLMLNLRHTHGGGLRGYHLYVLKMRGVFRNTLSRHYGASSSIPEKPIIRDINLSTEAIAEIEWRFQSLQPYLKQFKFDG